MQKLRFKKMDAFVYGKSGGNPAGCIYIDGPDTITPEQMQQIGREMAGCVSEVVFVYHDDGLINLRFFSCEREVAFCGHATIAVMYDLIKNDPELLRNPIIRIRINDREILVKNEIDDTDAVFIGSPPPLFLETIPEANAVAAALRIAPSEIADPEQIAVVDAGLVTLLVPLRTLSGLLATRPDPANAKEFCRRHGIEIILVYSTETSLSGSSVRTRVFAPVFGYLEDPATGSGNAALGYYLLSTGQWDGRLFTIEQGRKFDSPNIVRLVSGSSPVQRTVFFGGNATVRIEGEYLLS